MCPCAQLFHEALEQSRTELRSKGIDESTWPDALRPPAARAAADATDPDADDPTRRAYQEVDEEIKDLDIYLRTCVILPRAHLCRTCPLIADASPASPDSSNSNVACARSGTLSRQDG